MMQNSKPGISTLTEGKEGFIPCATSTRSLRLGRGSLFVSQTCVSAIWHLWGGWQK